MEYSDGTEDVEPGGTISADGQDLGTASYDADGDGVADSVIVGQDQYTVVITDHDGDGEADSITTYDSDGTVVDQKGDSGEVPDTEQTGQDTGSTEETSTGDSGETDSGDTGSDPDSGDSGDSGDTDTGDTDTSASSISVVDDQGRTVEVGEPTVDMNGDGTNDTAVVHGDDGSTTGYTDRNGDGEADQITHITADSQVTISVSDGSGGWEVESTGHIDEDGQFVPDESGSGTAGQHGSSSRTSEDSGDVVGDDTAVAVAPTAGVAADDTALSGTLGGSAVGISYTDASGQSYDLGEPTADFDGDGNPDTVVTTLEDGTVVGYSDVDGDGLTDQVTQINPDGSVTIGVPDGKGGWEEAATGTIGPDGAFVPADAATV